jgi:hypothetical protein
MAIGSPLSRAASCVMCVVNRHRFQLPSTGSDPILGKPRDSLTARKATRACAGVTPPSSSSTKRSSKVRSKYPSIWRGPSMRTISTAARGIFSAHGLEPLERVHVCLQGIGCGTAVSCDGEVGTVSGLVSAIAGAEPIGWVHYARVGSISCPFLRARQVGTPVIHCRYNSGPLQPEHDKVSLPSYTDSSQ